MKNLMKFSFMAVMMAGLLFATGCDDNEEIVIVDPDAEFDGVLEMVEGEGNKSVDITVDANSQATVALRVQFTSTVESMKRLYITQNVGGQGDEPYEITNANVDNKADGSLDIPAASANGIEYQIDLPVPSGVSEGTVVYQLWTTSGRGDYRDQSKRLAVGVGTVTLNYGGVNPSSELKSYTAKILAVAASDLQSETFISLADGKLYKIGAGEEYAALWDFGYYYGVSGTSAGHLASLASTSAYETSFGGINGVSFIDVDGLAGTTELNSCFFALSTTTAAEFTAAATAGDVNAISTPSSQSINDLAAGDIIEFVDNYGKKGLIEVVTVFLGQSGNGYDADAYIELNIKVQP